jgi:mRNA interferase MazF
LRRGDIVTVAAPGDYGKPRPAIVIQTDFINRKNPNSAILALITSTLSGSPLLRLRLEPDSSNKLNKPCEVMVDKLLTVRRRRIGDSIGRLNVEQLTSLNRLLAFVIGLA